MKSFFYKWPLRHLRPAVVPFVKELIGQLVALHFIAAAARNDALSAAFGSWPEMVPRPQCTAVLRLGLRFSVAVEAPPGLIGPTLATVCPWWNFFLRM